MSLGVMEKFVSTTSKEHHEYLELGHKLKARLDDILGMLYSWCYQCKTLTRDSYASDHKILIKVNCRNLILPDA